MAIVLVAGFGLARTALAQISPAAEMAHTNVEGRHIAPHDTFYTLEYVSARTDKGVDGFPPGTEVKLVTVNREARTLTVTDGKASIELPPEKLTNDMDIAALVQAKDNANQERVAAFQRTQAEAYQKYLKEVADYTAKDLEKRQQEIRDAEVRQQEQRSTAQSSTQTTSTNASDNGYYNQGGNGYGNPYGYFVDLNPPAVQNKVPARTSTNQNGGNSGTVSSQNTAPASSATRSSATTQTNGATQSNGAVSTGSAGAGVKKP